MYFYGFLFLVFFFFNQSDANQNATSIADKTCNLKYGRWLLKEGKEVTMNGKLYKVEDCQLQRAYQACSTHLWFMLNIVCGAIETQKGKHRYNNPVRRFTEEKLLSEACCENSCTVAELARYCP
ncbi:unnamed protein product [Adineta steineri]|uniref:Insulin-like domain-containing protein n=1 Tax=Adineta steineri TaxID=433720 RepID=A0A814NSR9_9BILA|nr:unnamed protein product [Adineta steineri]CAF0981426.1 unnamed protein product [Adineta steineri]CAF1095361.1 unnamed protein product [Adineta steineri]